MATPPLDIAEQARFVSGKVLSVEFSASPPTPAYDIVIGQSILADAATLIRQRLGARRCVIISDSVVEPLYRARLEAILTVGGHTVLKSIVIPAGEGSKNLSQIGAVADAMLAAGVDRKTLVVALGGGVVGDISGFAASLVMRGIDFVQVPTTLLAQVDSSVGGKTGVDTAHGKNTIGTFYQPRLVVIDVTLLDSLAERELRAGYAEVVKYGLIADPVFFRWCVAHGGQLLNGDHETQIQAISYSCAAKATIVAGDERETGSRALLNLGHTFAHALETATGFSSLLVHGEAVAIGTLLAFRMAVRMGLCPSQDYKDIRDHFLAVGLPVAPPVFAYDIDRLIELMKHDKKSTEGKITLILPHGIGHATIHRDADQDEIRAVWEEALSP